MPLYQVLSCGLLCKVRLTYYFLRTGVKASGVLCLNVGGVIGVGVGDVIGVM